MNKIASLKGVGVAMVTPFSSDQTIDTNALKKLSNNLISSKIQYLTILGTTAETATLTEDEKQLIIDTIMAENSGKKAIVIGIGGNNTKVVIENIKKISKIKGVDAILSVSPYYNKPSQKGIIEHYNKIADASDVPIIMYNVPGRTASNIDSDTILKLSEHKNIIGVKEASGNLSQAMEIIKNKSDDFLFISGDDNLAFAQTALGGDGIISVLANAYPNEISDIINNASGLNIQLAKNTHYKLLNLMNLIFKEGNPSGIKLVLKYLNVCSDEVRLPLTKCSEQLSNDMRKAIKLI